jgi:hypothetical protein
MIFPSTQQLIPYRLWLDLAIVSEYAYIPFITKDASIIHNLLVKDAPVQF